MLRCMGLRYMIRAVEQAGKVWGPDYGRRRVFRVTACKEEARALMKLTRKGSTVASGAPERALR